MKNTLYLFALLSFAMSTAQTNDCVNNSFLPTPGEQYVLQAWVQDEGATLETKNYRGRIKMTFTTPNGSNPEQVLFDSKGVIIDGWQRIEGVFTIPQDILSMDLELVAKQNSSSYFDDVRIFPVNGNMKSFVYDPDTQRLMAELDENNYATFYEYDKEGGLVRIKKETERGIYTIQETRSGNSTLNAN